MSKPIVAFVDHSFHEHTKSSDFFVDILSQYYTVVHFFDYGWCGGDEASIYKSDIGGFHKIIFWQIMPPAERLAQLPSDKIILIPMYDQIHMWHDDQLRPYSVYQTVCFCKALYKRFVELGGLAYYIQYFPKPILASEDALSRKRLVGFFWARVAKLQWQQIRTLLGETQFDTFYFHSAPDPAQEIEPPDEEATSVYNIKITQWFDRPEELYALLAQSSIYFAPRLYEGIGMAFLEAMAHGMCVVAPDFPTMNEYITDADTGLLYSYDNLHALDFTAASMTGKRAHDFISDGYKRWRMEIKKIRNILESTEVAYG